VKDLERDLIKAVSAALTDGQGGFTEEDMQAAYLQVRRDLVGGAAAQLVLDGLVALTVEDGGEVKYAKSSKAVDLPDSLFGSFREDGRESAEGDGGL
jgi:hypothetical protein